MVDLFGILKSKAPVCRTDSRIVVQSVYSTSLPLCLDVHPTQLVISLLSLVFRTRFQTGVVGVLVSNDTTK